MLISVIGGVCFFRQLPKVTAFLSNTKSLDGDDHFKNEDFIKHFGGRYGGVHDDDTHAECFMAEN